MYTEETKESLPTDEQIFLQNKHCADCNTPLIMEECLISKQFAILICKKCAYYHQKLGKAISDIIPFKPDVFHNQALLNDFIHGGNDKNREVYEFRKPLWFLCPEKNDISYVRQKYIEEKYKSKSFQMTEDDEKILAAKKEEESQITHLSKPEEITEIDPSEKHNYDRYWFFLDDSTEAPQCLGPFQKKYLGYLLRDENIDNETYVWHPSFTDWRQLGNVEILKQEIINLPIINMEQLNALSFIQKEMEEKPVKLLRGHLEKQNPHKENKWQRRWVVLSKKSLSYYHSCLDKEARGIISLEQIQIQIDSVPSKKGICLLISTHGLEQRQFRFWSEAPEEIFEWANGLRRYVGLCYKFGRKVKFEKDVFHKIRTNIESSPMYVSPADKEGYLLKKAPKSFSRDKYRWFVLRGTQLTYYENVGSLDSRNPKPKGDVNIEKCKIKCKPSPRKDKPYFFVVKTPKRNFELWADSLEERDEWIQHLKSASNR